MPDYTRPILEVHTGTEFSTVTYKDELDPHQSLEYPDGTVRHFAIGGEEIKEEPEGAENIVDAEPSAEATAAEPIETPEGSAPAEGESYHAEGDQPGETGTQPEG